MDFHVVLPFVMSNRQLAMLKNSVRRALLWGRGRQQNSWQKWGKKAILISKNSLDFNIKPFYTFIFKRIASARFKIVNTRKQLIFMQNTES